MPIYTKKGDKGTTTLFDPKLTNNERVNKDNIRLQTIGSLDELNSYLGIIKTSTNDLFFINLIKKIQTNIFTINSILAGARLPFGAKKITELEKLIDRLDQELPKLTKFILPGGSSLSAQFQYARSLTRHAERNLVSLNQIEKIKPENLKYINRLSDTLFTLARYANYKLGLKDDIWKQ